MSVLLSLGAGRRPRSLALAAILLVVGGTFLWSREHSPGSRTVPAADGCAGRPGAGPCRPGPGATASGGERAPVLRADEACRDVGYLCAALDTARSIVIRHWKDFHGTMVVHVPPPPFEDPATARRLQDAAADGILMWNGQPFPLVVDRDGFRKAQVQVRWTRTLGASRLGVAHTVWSPSTGLEVRSLELSTRNPFDSSRVLDPSQVTLTAAHEMGHALGLPHSDRRGDVMYPKNTARTLSARDYRTVEALYALRDGTRIVH
ncbi:MAG: matrixin family metalloprotease [Gemmatimonadetes bacterium]|nr:matrixin family metalloprotease [Gemmatimonadota bacterium]